MHRAGAALILVLLLLPAAAAQWPAFQRDSRNTGDWKDGPLNVFEAVWWEVSLGSHTEASPVVDQGLVVVADGSGKLRALDAETGRERWSHTMKGAVAGTPAIALGRVYAADTTGELLALDLRSGQVLARAAAGATRAPITFHEGKVFVGNEAGEMRSFAAGNLDLLWTFRTSTVRDASSYNNVTDAWTCTGPTHTARPVRTAAGVHEGIVVFGGMNHRVYAVSEHGHPDGSTDLQWVHRSKDIVMASPVIDAQRGRVIVASYDESVVSLPLRPAQMGEDPCYGHHASPVWRFDVPGLVDDSKVHSTPALANGRLHFGSNNGRLITLDAATGTPLWHLQTSDPVLASPAATGGVVVAAGDDGKVRWLEAATGTVLAVYGAGAPIKTAPALVGHGAIIVTDAGTVVRLGEPPPPRPDLVVTGLEADEHGFTVTVRNAGKAPAAATAVRVAWSDEQAVRLDVPPLEAGASATLRHDLAMKTGTVVLRAHVDPEDFVVEADTANNVLEENFFIAPPVPVEPLPTDEPEPTVEEEDEAGLPLWVLLAGGAVLVIALGVGGMLAYNRRQAKQ